MNIHWFLKRELAQDEPRGVTAHTVSATFHLPAWALIEGMLTDTADLNSVSKAVRIDQIIALEFVED